MCVGVYSATPGTSCSSAIPLGKNYAATISGKKTVWYSAWTFDLPLTVKFVPSSPSDPAPDVEMDFTCTPGVYTDSILYSLFGPNSGSSGIEFDMPHHPALSSKTEDGVFFYYLAMGESYRDLLLKTGIDYNVQVLVKVTFKAGGSISLVPDDSFSNCMDGYKFMHIGDTVQVKPLDKNRHVIVPYVQWQNDSIRYVWDGTAPCHVWVSGDCDFDPTDYTDEHVIERELLAAVDTAKVTSKDMSDWVKFEQNTAGMYYAKFYTTGTGTIKIERIPQAPPRGGATLLQYDKATPILANDTDALFAIPAAWDTTTLFTTPTDHIFKMYISTEPDFYLEDAMDSCQFYRSDDGHWYGFTEAQMQGFWEQTTDKYLYVRFHCTANTTVTPSIWYMSECLSKAILIDRPSQEIHLASGLSGSYRFYYNDWKDGTMTIKWPSNASTCPTYIGDTCSFLLNSSNVIVNYTIPKRGTWNIAEVDLKSEDFASKVDPDGFLYIRFKPNSSGKITISTTAPEEEDSPCNPYDSVLTVTAWDEYLWRGTNYTASGEYSDNGAENPDTHCIDTVYTLRLTILKTSYLPYAETACDSIEYGGKVYTESGIYLDTIYDIGGNRTIMTLDMTVNKSTVWDSTVTSCGTFEWRGNSYETSGEYQDTLINAAGCDSVCTLHLTVHPVPANTDTTAVVWDSIVWYGQNLKATGDYSITKKDLNECEYTHTLHLTVHTTSYESLPLSGCDSVIYNEKKYTIDGQYADTVVVASGDRTITTLDVTIKHPTTWDSTAVSCGGIEWHGEWYAASGEYQDTLINAAGCDSVCTLHLTVHPVPANTDTTAVVWDSIAWYGQKLKATGDYSITKKDLNECEYTHTLHLTVHTTSYESLPLSGCDSVIYNEKKYTIDGQYADTVVVASGDRTITTLDVTIHHPSTGEETKEACDAYPWNGHTYIASGDYLDTLRNAAGCDSIVTLHLTINECMYQYDTVYFCHGQNTEHEEKISDELIRRYLPYVYESPAKWDYMEGVILTREPERMQVDLRRAEQNLYDHYVGAFTPVKNIAWSFRPSGETSYQVLEVTEEPQWIAVGTVAVTVRFVCGQFYTSDFETDVITVRDEQSGLNGRKVLENGQIIIIRGGVKYNVLGTKIQ